MNAKPARRLTIVTCMDVRLDPLAILGLAEGDAHVIRNAGGVITDGEIRSLAISQHLLGTEEIALVHHTDCGLLRITDEGFAAALEAETGVRPAWSAHATTDLDASVRAARARIEASPFIPHRDRVRGYVYDVGTRVLREVR